MKRHIVPLAECPQYVDVCAAWAFGQWGSQHGGHWQQTHQRFSLCTQPSKDFITLMMVEDQRPLAMASLWPSDDHHRMELSPWLAGVFVHPDYRGQGIAKQLEQAIVELARQLQHPVLHLITDKSETLYQAWGWHTIERRQQYGGEVVVMEKRL